MSKGYLRGLMVVCAALAAAAQAACGSRASGHAGVTLNPPFGGNLAMEQYSFVALGTDPSTPLAVKAHYGVSRTLANGVVAGPRRRDLHQHSGNVQVRP